MTHYHWDHSGGHPFFSRLNAGVEFYSRTNYLEEVERARNQPPPYKWLMGEKFNLETIRSYKPTHTVAEDSTKVIGGTIRLIPLPGGGGETPDGMLVYLPKYQVLFAGDFIVPWVGSPFVREADTAALMETIDLIATIDPAAAFVARPLGGWAILSARRPIAEAQTAPGVAPR